MLECRRHWALVHPLVRRRVRKSGTSTAFDAHAAEEEGLVALLVQVQEMKGWNLVRVLHLRAEGGVRQGQHEPACARSTKVVTIGWAPSTSGACAMLASASLQVASSAGLEIALTSIARCTVVLAVAGTGRARGPCAMRAATCRQMASIA